MNGTETKKITNEIKGFIFALFIIIVLILTNPNENDFKGFLKKDFIERGYKEGEFSGIFNELLAEPRTWLVNQTTERKNYYIFSVYTVTRLDSKHTYLGIMKKFIEP